MADRDQLVDEIAEILLEGLRGSYVSQNVALMYTKAEAVLDHVLTKLYQQIEELPTPANNEDGIFLGMVWLHDVRALIDELERDDG